MSISNQSVLVAIDLDDKTLWRLSRSYPNLSYLADKVILLYVFENLDRISSEEERDKIVFDKDNQLSAFAEDIREKTGVEVRPVMQKGRAAEEILKAAESYNVDMIVMSTHSHPEDDHTLKHNIGSITNKVVRESKVPVFTFNSNVQLKKIRKILLPLDLTVETKQKVTNAIDLAVRFDASIHVVSIYWSKHLEDIRDMLKQQLDQVKNFIEEDDIACTAKLVESDGGERGMPRSILGYAESIDADLIMIMTQQETRLVEFFMGSAAQTILRLSRIPVLSIIPKELGY
jgi:nucleotide-binding universal stress UspA family protein